MENPMRPWSFMLHTLPVALALAGGAAPADGGTPPPANGAATVLRTAPVRADGTGARLAFDGTVEAVRQTAVAAQVPGAIVAIDIRAGDRVKAGQLLMRLDARSAEHSAAASAAQAQATRAELQVARRDFERQQQLFAQSYISRAALERAEAQFRATEAQLEALLAQAGAARTQTAFHRVLAPYAGVIADVPVALGDMAMPGRPLLTLYDPTALRVTVSLPQGVAARTVAAEAVAIELPSLADDARRVTPTRVTVLPTTDAATHTVQVRLDLPASATAARPGMFARVGWPAAVGSPTAAPRLYVPASALVRRAELTAVYVVDTDGRPLLRQVRPGPMRGAGEIEILTGLAANERVALDPQAAARVR
jgi:multidrug efflux system membrane fusion protein